MSDSGTFPKRTFRIRVLTSTFAVAQLEPDAPQPQWIRGKFVSCTRTSTETTIVCDASAVPSGVTCTADWRCLHVDAVMDFSLVGVLASLCGTLADASVGVFVCSTYDTDYILVQQDQLATACEALSQAGHEMV